MRKGSWLNHSDVPKLRTLYCGDTPLEDFTIHDKALIKCENCGTPALKSIHLWLRGVHRHACCRRFNRVNPKDAVEITCVTCNETKTVSEFYAQMLPTGPSYRTECKQCRNVKRYAAECVERDADPIGMWSKIVLYQSRHRAQKGGYPHTLTPTELQSICRDTCIYCGKVLKYNQRKGAMYDNASLDKIIPARGYVLANTVVACFRCNWLKCNASLNEMEALVVGLRRVLTDRGLPASTVTAGDQPLADDLPK
jgi:hypothetical protein